MSPSCQSLRCRTAPLLIFAVVALVLAIVLPAVIQKALDDGIRQQILLSPEAEANGETGWQNWVSNDGPNGVPDLARFYVWNTTNAEDVMNGAKPQVQQVGPYTYIAYDRKFNWTWAKDRFQKDILYFKEYEYYSFSPKDSAPGLDPDTDVIICPNMGFFAFYYAAKDDEPTLDLFYDSYKDFPEWQRFYWTKTPNQLIFADNFTDPVLDALGIGYPGIQENHTSIQQADKYDFNSIYTGAHDLGLAGSYRAWRGMESMEVPKSPIDNTPVPPWGDAEANRIQGFDGNTFPPLHYVEKNSSVLVFSDDLLRTIALVNYGGTVITQSGIDLLKLTFDMDSLLNDTENPNNAPYFSKLSGFWNLSAAEGAPILISLPHFLGVPVTTATKIGGLTPNQADHELVLGVEPYTGVTMYGRKRFQVNVYHEGPQTYHVSENETVTWFEKVIPAMAHPVTWTEFGGQIPEKDAKEFRGSIYTAVVIANIIKWLGLSLAILAILVSLVLVCVTKPQTRYEETLLDHVA